MRLIYEVSLPIFNCLHIFMQEHITFKDLSKGFSRRTAASCFLEVLQLKTWGVIEAKQNKPEDVGEIRIGYPFTGAPDSQEGIPTM